MEPSGLVDLADRYSLSDPKLRAQLDEGTEVSKLAILLAMAPNLEEIDLGIYLHEGTDFQGCADALTPAFAFMRSNSRSLSRLTIDLKAKFDLTEDLESTPRHPEKNLLLFLSCFTEAPYEKFEIIGADTDPKNPGSEYIHRIQSSIRTSPQFGGEHLSLG
ncbi:hypothetical protein BCR34DRAFT_333322 [Clohesyomyces aquaticus]|uniref:Uncharacterized protein n=1 Tax=Clohesyomyces aquaticus TaxID=1231657 RepID=A0A1Y1ZLR7_9PLEO|nr:hypothetical protein BCR34DRAFT_333322 [Clohesyomyces aquaticus]